MLVKGAPGVGQDVRESQSLAEKTLVEIVKTASI